MNPAGPTPPPAVPPVTPAGALTPDPTLPNPTAPPPPRPSRKKTFIIAGSIAAAVLLVAGGVTWYMLDQNAQRKQAQVSAVSSVVTSFFTNARQGSLASVDALLLPNLDKEKVSHIETLSKQIGRDCAVDNASVNVRTDTPQTAGAQAACRVDQQWVFELQYFTKPDKTSEWFIGDVTGSNLIPTVEQAVATDPYATVSEYEEENKPKAGSCLSSEDASLFVGTSLPRDPFMYFYQDTVLFETGTTRYYPPEKATDQFDAFERFYRLTSARRYVFEITPQAYATTDTKPVEKLANERAELVKESLKKRGVPEVRLKIMPPENGDRTKPDESRGVVLYVRASRECEP